MQLSLRKTEDLKDHILTAIFIFLAFIFMVNRHDGGLQTVRKASLIAISYIEKPISKFRVYRTALETNEKLGEQNILLQDEISRLRSVKTEIQALRNLLSLKEDYSYDLISVAVVAKNLTGINNSFTVNRGTGDGVKTGMALITSEGLIGQVILATPNHALVLPFSNPLFRVSARIQGNRAYGIVSWNTENPEELVMNYVPRTVNVTINTTVETSGFSNQFPPNIPIGKVIRTEAEEGRDTQQIFIKPFVSLHKASEAFIVLFEPEPEIDDLLKQFETLFQ